MKYQNVYKFIDKHTREVLFETIGAKQSDEELLKSKNQCSLLNNIDINDIIVIKK